MTNEQATRRVGYMWAKLGRTLEQRAYERAESGSSIDMEIALALAKSAEGCFWQSTGDSEGFWLKGAGDGI